MDHKESAGRGTTAATIAVGIATFTADQNYWHPPHALLTGLWYGMWLLGFVTGCFWAYSARAWARQRGWEKPARWLMVLTGFGLSGFWLYAVLTPAPSTASAPRPPKRVAQPHKTPPPPVDAPIPTARPELPQATPRASLPTEVGQIEPQKQNARLASLRPEFVPAGPDQPPGTQALRVNYQNKGSNPAGSPASAAMSFVVDALPPDAEINALSAQAAKGAYSPHIFDSDRPEVDFDQTFFKWAPGVFLSPEAFQAVKDGKKTLLVFFAMTYTDSTLKPRQYWELTYTFMFKGSVTEWSNLRFRTVMRKAPK